MVGPQASAHPSSLVAPGRESALPSVRVGAVVLSPDASVGRLKACNVNVEGSRMREIRLYGLTRGRWPVRLARRAGVYSTAPAGTPTPAWTFTPWAIAQPS